MIPHRIIPGPDVCLVLSTRHVAVRSNVLTRAGSRGIQGRGRLCCRGLDSAIDLLELENVIIFDQLVMRLLV